MIEEAVPSGRLLAMFLWIRIPGRLAPRKAGTYAVPLEAVALLVSLPVLLVALVLLLLE